MTQGFVSDEDEFRIRQEQVYKIDNRATNYQKLAREKDPGMYVAVTAWAENKVMELYKHYRHIWYEIENEKRHCYALVDGNVIDLGYYND